jgi:hypothetical protein
MTNPKLLIPLRVPELGPYLGKIVTGTGREPGGLDLDAWRYRLATRVIESAGEARRLAAREERQAALAAVGRTAWLEAWEETVAGVAELLLGRATAWLDAAAAAVRMPPHRRERLALGAAEQGALAARLGSAGAALVPALDRLEEHAAAALQATALERGELEAWQESLATCARRLEAAWLELEEAVDAEVARWRRVVGEVSRWRKPLWPVVLVGAIALAAAVWLGLVLGGYIGLPRWLVEGWGRVMGR